MMAPPNDPNSASICTFKDRNCPSYLTLAFGRRSVSVKKGEPAMRRIAYISLGVLLGLMGLAAAPLPVPVEIPLLGGSAILILRNSAGARRLYVRGSHRWPRTFTVADRILRRTNRRRQLVAA